MHIEPYRRKMTYYETDQMGVIYNGNYIHLFDETRDYFTTTTGFPYVKMEEEGVLICVLGVQCSYHQPLRYGDTAEIYSYISFFNGYKMTVKYRIYRQSDGIFCADGETKHGLVTKDFKPCRIKQEHREIYDYFNKMQELGLSVYDLPEDMKE